MSVEEKIASIEKAIEEMSRLEITYLKNSDAKSRLTIEPYEVGEMEYAGRPFLGVRGMCLSRNNDERVFRVDRILEMDIVDA